MKKYITATFIMTLIFTNNCLQLKQTRLNHLNNQILQVNCRLATLKTENDYLKRKKRIVKIKKKYSHFLSYKDNHLII